MEENENNDIEMKDENTKKNNNDNSKNIDIETKPKDDKLEEINNNKKKINSDDKENNNEEEKIDKENMEMDKEPKQDDISNEKSKEKMEIETDKEKEKTKDIDEDEKKDIPEVKERSIYSLEGAKEPLSIYTRRVMNISKINEYLKEDSSKGKCGGRNLGNTCFMNSSIACLSNCTELTYYFLKGDYKKDINEENNLGMRGALANSWGELLHQYWVEDTRVGDPSDFKDTIGRKAVRFRGYGQQDSNEFMSVFLDYLNEDLNRTTKKEYIEMKEKQEDETDEECAKRYWECNLKRNDSIITDLFCGQFKSTITCPDCGFINITFDPFDTVNLPLLTQVKRYSFSNEKIDEFHFIYIPKYCIRNPYSVTLKNLTRDKSLRDVTSRIKKETNFIYHDKMDDLFMVDMYQKSKFLYPEYDDSISKFLCTHEYVFSYDFNKKENEIQIPAYFWENNDKDSSSEFPRMIFLKKENCLDDIRKKLYIYIRKYILSPFLKPNEKIDALSKEYEKYINDKTLQLNEDDLITMIDNEYQEIFSILLEEGDEEKMDEEEKEKDENEKNEEKKENENKETKEETDKKIENENYIEEKKEEEKKYIEMKDIIIDSSTNEETNKDNNNQENENKTEEEKGNQKDKIEEEKQNETISKNKEELLKDFIKDMPFKIYIRKERCYYDNPDLPFFDKNNFNKLSKDFKNAFSFKSFKDTLDKTEKDIKDYEIIVEFNKESKYINENTFKLDEHEQYSLEFEIKKVEPKKEGEEEDDGKMTLEKCLKKFCKEEQLGEGDEWYCSKCKKHVLAKKKMEFFYLPKILIICFKRFVKDSYRWEKNDDEVDFPINDLDMKDFVIGPDREHSKYDLFAVSQHYGSTGFGHYTAVCKNDGQWYSYNDSSCSITSESDALSSAAYVLFYRRQTD